MSDPTITQVPEVRKSTRSEGYGVPEWLNDQGIRAGEWQIETKPRLRRQMTDETWTDKARVSASLSLHSFGFSNPVAVTLEAGKLRLLTRADIARETGMKPPAVRRALAQLEADGWIERRSASGKEELERGDIEIRVFAIPRPSSPLKEDVEPVEEPAALPAGLPDELLRYLKRYKVRILPKTEELERAKTICHQLTELEGELLRVLRPEPENGGAQATRGTRAAPVKKAPTGPRASVNGSARTQNEPRIKSLGVKEKIDSKELASVASNLEAIAKARLPRLRDPLPNSQTCLNFLAVIQTLNPAAVAGDVPPLVFSFVKRADQESRNSIGFETWGGVFKAFRELYEVAGP